MKKNPLYGQKKKNATQMISLKLLADTLSKKMVIEEQKCIELDE